MSDIGDALWSALILGVIISAAAFWVRMLPELVIMVFPNKNTKWVEFEENAWIPTEIYLSKTMSKFHLFPDCPSLVAKAEPLEVCNVCHGRVGSRYLSRRFLRKGLYRDQVVDVCFICGEDDHLAKRCPYRRR